ncbi:MAG TPA: hypothetical protein VF316_00935 [Polyangiaceae bacterium]
MKLNVIGLSFLLAACGARTPLGTRDAGATDAPAIGVECTWAVTGPAVRISADPVNAPGDVRLEDAVATTGGALVAWSTPVDTRHPQTIIARRVGFDLVSNGDEHVVFSATAAITHALWYVSLASGYGHVAAVAWDGTHCLLRPITVDGASNGAMVDVVGSPCERIAATSPGFDLLFRKPGPAELDLLSLDPVGHPLAPAVPVFSAGPGSLGATGRATLSDGSFVAAAMADGGRVISVHRDAHGAPLGSTSVVSQSPIVVSTLLSTAPVAGGALVSWVELDGVSARIEVSPLRADASPLGAPLVAASSPTAITAIDIAPEVMGGALLAWTTDPAASSVHLLSLSAVGTPRGAPLVVPDPVPGAHYEPAVRVVTTGKQGLVFFEVRTDTTPHRVYAAPLACTP